MDSVRRILIIAFTGILLASADRAGFGQASAASEQLHSLQEELRRAHAAGDAASYLDSARRMHEFLNGSPASVLQLMSAQAFAGQQKDALHSLTQFVRMGQANEEVLKAKQFDALRMSLPYSRIQDEMAANTASVSVAEKAFALPAGAAIPEDIDYDPATKLFYVSSVANKDIFAVDLKGHARIFAKAPDDWPMMALKVDVRRRLLWATEVALDGFTLTPHEDWGRSAIVVYELKTGKVLRRIEGPAHAALGDMTLMADGDAIVSDGDLGGVYRVRRRDGQLIRLDSGDFISPQTAAMSPDGQHLFVPDYVRGIGILNLETKAVTWVPTEGRYALSGIDGLYLSGRTLLATQNGSSPERVVRFELDAMLSRVESEALVERATATLGDPTHGVVVDGCFYYIANSGWNLLDEHGNLKPGMNMPESLVMRVKLGAKPN